MELEHDRIERMEKDRIERKINKQNRRREIEKQAEEINIIAGSWRGGRGAHPYTHVTHVKVHTKGQFYRSNHILEKQ